MKTTVPSHVYAGAKPASFKEWAAKLLKRMEPHVAAIADMVQAGIRPQVQLRPYQVSALRQLAKGSAALPLGVQAGAMDMLLVLEGWKGQPCPTVQSIADAYEWPLAHKDSPTLVSMWQADYLPYDHVSLRALSIAGQNMLHRPPRGGY